MSCSKIGGLVIPSITPFRDEDAGQIDTERLDRLTDYLIDVQKADALIPLGTTGEATSLSRPEKELVIGQVLKKVNKRVPVYVGTGCANIEETISLTRFAESCGAAGVLVVVPYYIRPDQEGLYRYFKKVAQSTSLPILVYNIPVRTAVNMCVDTILRVASIDNIAGIKDCFYDIAATTDLIRRCREELKKPFTILTGEDTNIFTSLCLGADGAVAATGHIVGHEIKKMMQQLEKGSLVAARDIQFRIHSLQKFLFSAPNPAPVKAALDLTGTGLGGSVRLPLVDMDGEARDMLAQALAAGIQA